MITRYLVLNNKDMNEEDLIQAVSMSGELGDGLIESLEEAESLSQRIGGSVYEVKLDFKKVK